MWVHELAGEEVDPELPVELAAGGAAGVVKEEGMIEMGSVAKEPSAMIAS